MFPGYRLVTETRSLEFTGWAFGADPVCVISTRLNGVPYPSRAAETSMRSDVAAAFPGLAHTETSGFSLHLTLPDDADHDLAICFKSGEDAVDLSIRIRREALAGIPYVRPNTVANLYDVLVGQPPTSAMLNLIMRQGSARLYNREDYIQMISSRPEFRSLLHNSDVFSRFVDVEFSGCSFRLPERDHITLSVIASRSYEPYVIDYLLESLSEGSVFVDIGANMGLFAIPAGKKVGATGKVYAVEALSRNAKIIAVNAELNGLDNVHLLPLGAAEQVGANFWFRQDGSSNNSISDVPRLAGRSFNDFDLIGVAPIDALIPEDEKVDVIKLDIEGREYRALLGAMGIIKASRPMIFCEYNPDSQKAQSGVEGVSLLSLLLDLNYEIEILHRGRPRELVRGSAAAKIEYVTATWDRHHRDEGGTQLDLCFVPG
jgi:FkbM family methyltransferase